jgi:hypothetical protein
VKELPPSSGYLSDEVALAPKIQNLRGALAWIHNSTEPDAIPHRSHEALVAGIYNICKLALDGEFVDDMHAAEVYDTLKRQEAEK